MHLAAITTAPGGLDELLFHLLNLAGTNAVLDALMVFITTLGGTFVVALFAFFLWGQQKREAAADFVLLLLLSEIFTSALKILVDRSRPCAIPSFATNTLPGYGCATEPDPSFPSGHASRAFALAAFVGLRFRWKAGTAATVFAALVGVSRIYLGVHWPTDILGGVLLGTALALAIEFANRRVAFYQRVRKRLVDLIPHWPSRRTA